MGPNKPLERPARMPGVKPNAWRPAAQRRFVRLVAVRSCYGFLARWCLGGADVAMNLPRGGAFGSWPESERVVTPFCGSRGRP